jgi:hypothetical protein
VADVRLQTNTLDPTWYSYPPLSAHRIWATKFQVTAAGYLKEIAWYKNEPGQVALGHLVLWGAGNAIVYEALPVPDGQPTPGWQRHILTTDVPLATGVTYAIGMDGGVGIEFPAGQPADRGAAPTPFVHDDTKLFLTSSAWPTYPTTANQTIIPGLDVVWTDTAPTAEPPGEEPEVVDNVLAEWFDPVAAIRPTGDPGLYPRVAAKLDLTDFAAFIAQISDIWEIAGVLADLEIAAANAVTEKIRGWLGWTADDATALRRPDGTTVLDDTQAIIVGNVSLEAQLNSMQAQLTALEAAISNMGGAIGAFPTGWTLLAEVEWETFIAWPEPAHLYVVNITGYPAGSSRREFGDLAWLPRAAWWAPLNGTQVGERRFAEFSTQQLHIGGQAMPGILLASHPGWSGTLQAWGAP